MIGIPLGLLAANGLEWAVHKHVLHGLGKRKSSMWSFHWHEHHRACRQHEGRDPNYDRPLLGWHAQGKEALGLVLLGVSVAPLFPVAPGFVGALWWSGLRYYKVHKRSHEDPEWAREHLPWHYDHHMGPKQDANWCVSRPWFDHIMGTRVPYVGTPREAADRARRAARAASAGASAGGSAGASADGSAGGSTGSKAA